MKHTLSIVCNHLLAFEPRCFICSTSTSSLPAALLFFSAAIPFLYSSSLKGCAIVGVPSWIGGSIGGFDFLGIIPWPFMSNWCATWVAFTRHGGFGVVGCLDSFLIIYHAIRLLRVKSVEVMTSSQLFLFSSLILTINVFPVSMVVSLKGSIVYCFLYASYRLFNSSGRPGMWFDLHPLGMCFLNNLRNISTNRLLFSGIASTSSMLPSKMKMLPSPLSSG